MDAGRYLPSTQFTVMAGSLLLAVGLVVGTQKMVGTPTASTISPAVSASPFDENWEQTLEQIQLEAGVAAPAPASQAAVDELLTAAQSDNLTTTIGRTLLVQLSAANSEGLGSDVPTQDSLIEAAAAQVGAGIKTSYTASALIRVPQTPESLRTYGNQVMQTIAGYPKASASETLFAFGSALDYQDSSKLAALNTSKSAYLALAGALAATPVPETLAPLHLQVANQFAAMGQAAGEMATVLQDPLRGLGGLQVFQTSGGEAARLLTVLAASLRNNGILFTKDEPGDAWSAFASP